MFTGLVAEIGKVEGLYGDVLKVNAHYRPQIGDSIAVNGACLTVIELTPKGFSMQIGRESQKHIALENYTHKVHLEPALRADGRLDGHFVQGHIDSIGILQKIENKGEYADFWIQIPKETLPFMIPKGSIAIEGVSLTINAIDGDLIRLGLIKQTLKETLFGEFMPNRRLNIESDIFVRTVAHLMRYKEQNEHSQHLFEDFLKGSF